MLKGKVVTTYFMFVQRNEREQFQRNEGHFIDFHAILNKKPLESAWSVDLTRSLLTIDSDVLLAKISVT